VQTWVLRQIGRTKLKVSELGLGTAPPDSVVAPVPQTVMAGNAMRTRGIGSGA
jgi:hypothetical protein